jgi:hypothetical protein
MTNLLTTSNGYMLIWDALVGLLTGYKLEGRRSIPGRGKIFTSNP